MFENQKLIIDARCDFGSDVIPPLDGLVCFQRYSNEHVPGCKGGDGDRQAVDYCIKKDQSPDNWATEHFSKVDGEPRPDVLPLQRCQGEPSTSCDCVHRPRNRFVLAVILNNSPFVLPLLSDNKFLLNVRAAKVTAILIPTAGMVSFVFREMAMTMSPDAT